MHERWQTETVRISWILFYTAEELLVVCIKTVFSDEFMFRIIGLVNKKIVKIRGVGRPDEHNPLVVNRSGVLTWCSISKQCVIGAFFEDENATGASYQNILFQYTLPRFRLPVKDFIFPQYRAARHFSSHFTTFLSNERPNNWIGSGTSCFASTLSQPDPLQFLFFGSYQNKIYSTTIGSMEEEKHKQHVGEISHGNLTDVWDNTKLQLNYIMNVESGHVKNIIN